MIEPVRPNTLSTGTDTAAGLNHTGAPPDIERTSPFAPFVSPILFPIRVRPLLNVRIFSFVLSPPLNVPTSLISPLITPLSVLTVLVTSARDPEIVETSTFVLLSDPESDPTVLLRETRFPLSVFTVLERVEITPDSIDILPSVLLTTPDSDR